ncbi:uncharacterized protein LODBEIA_P34140 [Lodderomyces beijingensis]|uniref:Extracellular membrane protein CFEM domain-containing protein n=1 Tax=Lodderomyces beijingensis TaxID=1775926 RepID=A0ABP0ZM07_9ASCO
MQVLLYFAMLVVPIWSLTLDTSGYSPDPPTKSTTATATTTTFRSRFSGSIANDDDDPDSLMEVPFFYTQQFAKMYQGDILECMQTAESSFVQSFRNCSSASARDQLGWCRCRFFEMINSECSEVGLNNDSLWYLIKLDNPECGMTY